MKKTLPDLPQSLAPYVVVDLPGHAVHADARRAGDPLLHSWTVLCHAAGIPMRIVQADPEAISEMKRNRAQRKSTPAHHHVPQSRDMRQVAVTLLKTAAQHNASDLHLLLRQTHAEVQIRVKGRLRVMEKLAADEGRALSRAFFQGLATVKQASYNPLEFQDGQIAGDVLKDTGLSSVRLVRGPSYPVDQGCGFLVARLQYQSARPMQGQSTQAYPYPQTPPGEMNLRNLGYTDEQAEIVEELASAPSGIVIISGPTGSGKTFTLHEVLKHIARQRPYRRLITIESPVEHPMPWAIQLQATDTSKSDDAFGDRLVSTLRADPDILLIGELRSAASAIPARDAAITGHMVWTTLHVDDPYMAIDRLEGMDRQHLNRQLLCDHKIIRGFIGQRLVGHLCPHCSLPLPEHPGVLPERILSALPTWGDVSGVRLLGPGCASCSFDGIQRMIAVAEVVKTTPELMAAIARGGAAAGRAAHRASAQAGPTMLESAMRMVFEGRLDPREVEEAVDIIAPKATP